MGSAGNRKGAEVTCSNLSLGDDKRPRLPPNCCGEVFRTQWVRHWSKGAEDRRAVCSVVHVIC